MQDENGNKLPDDAVIRAGLEHLAEANAFFYEVESAEAKALAYHTLMVLHYGHAILEKRDPRDIEAYIGASQNEF